MKIVLLSLAALFAAGLLAWLLDWRPIEGVRNWWRQWSTRLMIVQLALAGLQTFDPATLLGAWNMMPGAVREMLPGSLLQAVGGILFVLNLLAILARQVRQTKLEKTDGQ